MLEMSEMRIALVGGYDREFVQTFLGVVLPKGGVTEVRVLNFSNAPYLKGVIEMVKLVHDFEPIHGVALEELLIKDGHAADLVVFLNSSLSSFEDFATDAFQLVHIIYDAIKKSAVENLKILFGDNNRGLLQHAYMDKLMNNQNPQSLQLTTVSSVYDISKTLNSSDGEYSFRSFPKSDGEAYSFDPSGEMTAGDAEKLSEDLSDKISSMEAVFNAVYSAGSYPYVEGAILGRFVELFVQTRSWETTKRDHGLAARIPSNEEKIHYGLDFFWPLFLPPVDAKRLPELVHVHLKQTSRTIEEKMASVNIA